MPALRVIERLPRGRQQDETAENRDDAQYMQDAEMRIAVQAEQRPPQMPGIVRERIDARIRARQPARKQVDRQREAVHLREQRDDEGRKGAKGTPVAAGLRLSET